ncbi:hypothetical protein OHA72_40685 [Dactylosporangium sp. NBC_01737]|uniref:hypothetical protein n=1 Tax=Dactylosporangium sp. NBC_01737 TaxID=2975959 RepID=UPI002E128929|nr:hypothetical protein OHA72_40685 [Dactylosporangium sp. NBC_01737]
MTARPDVAVADTWTVPAATAVSGVGDQVIVWARPSTAKVSLAGSAAAKEPLPGWVARIVQRPCRCRVTTSPSAVHTSVLVLVYCTGSPDEATAATETVPAVSGVSGVPVQVMRCSASASAAAAGVGDIAPRRIRTDAAVADRVLTGPRRSSTPNAVMAVSPVRLRLEGGRPTRRPAVEDRNVE